MPSSSCRFRASQLGHPLGVVDRELPPLPARQSRRAAPSSTGLPAFTPLGPLATVCPRAELAQPAVDVALEDIALVVAVLGQPLDLGALDRHGALVLVDTAAREHAHLDDGAR